MEMIRNQWDNVRHFGLQYELESCLVQLGLKKRLSIRTLQKRERCYEQMPLEEREKELKKWYRKSCRKELNLNKPTTFNEKIQWIKLYGATEQTRRLSDKYLVREWIKEKIGEEYLIPLLGVWNTWEEVDFKCLPESFVLKCNHGSGMNILVKEKAKLDMEDARRKICEWMQFDFAFLYQDFQMQYYGIDRKILAEKYMQTPGKADLTDYKFHCFDGKPTFCQVIANRRQKESIDFYDMDWKHQNFIDEPVWSPIKNSETEIQKPIAFEQMKKIAAILSEGFPYVRVDLYEIDSKPYFGEMTFTPGSGGGGFQPDEMDRKMGDMIHLNLEKRVECG